MPRRKPPSTLAERLFGPLDAIWSGLRESYDQGLPTAFESVGWEVPRYARNIFGMVFVPTAVFALLIGDMRAHGALNNPAFALGALLGFYVLLWLIDLGLLYSAKKFHPSMEALRRLREKYPNLEDGWEAEYEQWKSSLPKDWIGVLVGVAFRILSVLLVVFAISQMLR